MRPRTPARLFTQVSGANLGVVEHLLGIAAHGDNA
jgi:hypothetical protein